MAIVTHRRALVLAATDDGPFSFERYECGVRIALYTPGMHDVQVLYDGEPVHNGAVQALVLTPERAQTTAALLAPASPADQKQRYIPPTLLADVPADARIMQEEIFGPVLPILGVDDVDEAMNFVNSRDKPLALYVYSGDESVAKHVIDHTSAGGSCIRSTSCETPAASSGVGTMPISARAATLAWYSVMKVDARRACAGTARRAPRSSSDESMTKTSAGATRRAATLISA